MRRESRRVLATGAVWLTTLQTDKRVAMTDVEQTRTLGQDGSRKRKPRRTRIGVVETDARDKTIKVRTDRLMKHRKYGKYLKRRGVLHVHDEKGEAHVGDLVEIMECRPISKSKNWRLSRVVRSFSRS